MGYGDFLMAIGDARDIARSDPSKKVAIGNGRDLEWNALSEGLPFLITPEELAAGQEVNWVISYSSHRPYIDYPAMRTKLLARGWTGPTQNKHLIAALGHYMWNYGYEPKPAMISFSEAQEQKIARLSSEPYVAIEPYIKERASPNKQWPLQYMAEVVKSLSKHIKVVQVSHASQDDILPGIERITSNSFKDALIYLKAARLYIGPEGGFHHAAAGLDTPAVVTFGGFISPRVTGYASHVNLVGSATYACGIKTRECPHCAAAMFSITPEEVTSNAERLLINGRDANLDTLSDSAQNMS
jgi:ADP-heptose:LPS heptosyltransferase